jgi:hypothetical protein
MKSMINGITIAVPLWIIIILMCVGIVHMAKLIDAYNSNPVTRQWPVYIETLDCPVDRGATLIINEDSK